MKRTTGQNRAITRNWRPATQAVRGGTWRSEHGETSEALYLTSGYTYDDAATVAARFAGDAAGMTYSRLQNPTVEMLEERIALMEGAEACRAQATGMAAMTTALLCQLSQGDHVVAARAAFGSCRWLTDTLLAALRHYHHDDRFARQRGVGGGDPAQHQSVLLRNPRQPDDGHRRHAIRLRSGPSAWDYDGGRQCIRDCRAAAADGTMARTSSPTPRPR